MIDHDRLFKELISTFFVEFLDLFLPQVASQIDRDSIQFLPQDVFTDVTSGEKKEIDLLAQVRYQQQKTYFLIHVENQSYTESEFAKRMFKYFARLHEKYDLPIYPVVIFSFDEPKRAESQNYRVTFPNLKVLEFQFAAIQLNRLSWRDFLTQYNPVAAALMAKMNIAVSERPQVKAECLRLLTTLRLDPARMQLISGFVDTYLQLDDTEKQVFQAVISTMGLDEREEVMQIVTSWQQEGVEIERRETISTLLKVRFGNLDSELEAIIPRLMQLSREEYLGLLLQADREELLSRFQR
ncbi:MULTISPECIES: Rpn family recombination-promoting nuclease/putative transposase [Nostoc]|uniref:Rpn family recombination-promoting nuclease/putative transposase n=2 Tax=Nostoc TaxID=1177 RepID=A0ABR8IL66_9NOSO|nr:MULTISPECIES: Rpn family recombination-promoting nuclease/putative transposase [Nostoc]MBD2565644.1 Rpn family recombination-promoting nuclease/putative transposase [Nostoc linckia FACHB-391]MBD2651423.1 Rpn family recombination-promoting nuclease/putative transposase [Nostoc foliaceum FACHB-393]